MDIKSFETLPLMGILRGIEPGDVRPILEAVISAGLETIEITMNTVGAADLIREAVEVSGGRIRIGAGTVLSEGSMKQALDAGATFIVMPACVSEVMAFCSGNNIPVFPGALTPHEVLNAWQSGASMVKVFPSGLFGPRYFKELKGPFDKIKLMAVGGVRPENIAEFFEAGADAVAFGSAVFRKEWLEKKDYASIGSLVSEYVSEVKRVKGRVS